MALLQNADRALLHRDLMQDLSRVHDVCGAITKTDLRSAVDAADQWLSDNAANYNTALPQLARDVLTRSQKARLLMLVIAKRFNTGV